jgi:hypothetical protein
VRRTAHELTGNNQVQIIAQVCNISDHHKQERERRKRWCCVAHNGQAKLAPRVLATLILANVDI